MFRQSRWVIDLVVITLFLWVAAGIIASIAGQMLYEFPRERTGKQATALQTTKQSSPKQAYDIIVQRDLLQVPKKRPASSTEVVIEQDVVRPIAEMGLSLKGTITGPKEISRAIIEEKNEQKSFKIGENVKGAKILAIYRNKVIMDVNGQEQMLIVEEPRSSLQASAPRRREARAPTRPAVPEQREERPSGMTDIMRNLDQYIGKARVVPYFREGEPYGFRVSNVTDEALIYELGVRSGDIIKSVNGIPVRTPEDAFLMYQELQNESSVELELERQGQSTTINVPLR
ncbi:MAG: type II secretion system protein GspC [Desulfomonilia bacterium]|nr:type II secretion system protein GspC [Desulfomonilia bacterium]